MAASCKFCLFVYLLATGLLLAVSGVQQSLSVVQPSLCNPSHVPDIKMDTARLTVQNDQPSDTIILRMQSSECYECDMMPVAKLQTNCTVLVDTRWPVRVDVLVSNNTEPSPSCSEANNTRLYQEGGEYFLYIQHIGPSDTYCSKALMNTPADANIPIYVAIGIAVFLAFVWVVGKKLYRRGVFHRILCFWSTESVMSEFGTPTSINPTEEAATEGSGSGGGGDAGKVKKERLRSLDTFRGISLVIMIFVNYHGGYYWFFRHSKWNGLTVADLVFPCLSLTIMVFVNYGGGGYWQFSHSVWDGLTVADLVFPWFVYIMGTAMILSFQAQLRRQIPKLTMFWKIIRRSIILFALGLLINSGGQNDGVDLDTFRIPGVLQRFAGTYLIVASVHLLFAKPFDASRYERWAAVRDIIDFWPEWVVQISLVALHTALTFGMSVPGCPMGYLGAGGLAEHGNHTLCTGGAAGYIDRKVFGGSHIYQHPTCKEIYNTVVPYDPEGLLGTLTSCFICFLGLQAGKILFIYKDWVQRCVRFAIWGIVLGLIAGILCKFSKNDGWIPINKNLWSLSFVLALAGMAFILLMVCYLLIDVYKVWSGAPFYYPGMNSIVLYVGHELLSGRFPVAFDVDKNHGAQLAMNLWGTCFWVLVAYYLYFQGIFISV